MTSSSNSNSNYSIITKILSDLNMTRFLNEYINKNINDSILLKCSDSLRLSTILKPHFKEDETRNAWNVLLKIKNDKAS